MEINDKLKAGYELVTFDSQADLEALLYRMFPTGKILKTEMKELLGSSVDASVFISKFGVSRQEFYLPEVAALFWKRAEMNENE